MPHDCNGNEVKVGQFVSMKFRVTGIHEAASAHDGCNVTMTALEQVYASSAVPPGYLPQVTCNTRLVKLEGPADWERGMQDPPTTPTPTASEAKRT